MLLVVRDPYPTYRVDLTELFSRYLLQDMALDWVMRRDKPGPEVRLADLTERETHHVSAKSDRGGILGFLETQASVLKLKFDMLLRVVQGRWDLVQVRDEALTALPFLLASKIARAPFCYWMSFPIVEEYRHRALVEMRGPKRIAALAYHALADFILYRIVLPGADHVFVQSDRMKQDVCARGIDAGKITPVPMGVNTALYSPQMIAPTTDPRLEGRRVLVYVGATSAVRRLDLAVEALGLIVQAGQNAVLVIVGGPSESETAAIVGWANAAGVNDRVLFTGHLELQQMLSYVRRADVCLSIYPTWPDYLLSGTPTKLVEYVAMGRPVVANAHPDQSLVLAQSGAGLVTELTAGAIATAILEILTNPAIGATAAVQGPAWVNDHRSYLKLSQTVLDAYRRLSLVRSAASVNADSQSSGPYD